MFVNDTERFLRKVLIASLYKKSLINTRHLFSMREFQSMKPTAFLINTSRGGVVNTRIFTRKLKID
ncbi:MAG: NAD(P)-dependent oxidoreductase [Flavisolibacter sp.]